VAQRLPQLTPVAAGGGQVTVTAPGLDVRVVGAGSRIGYLHGDLGSPDRHPFLDALAVHAEVIAPSLPGFDGSDPKVLDSVHDWIVELSEIADATGLTGRPLVASSLGAMLALELCAVRPNAFSELVLIAPYGLWDDADPAADPWAVPTAEQPAMFLTSPAQADAFYLNPDRGDPMDAEMRRYRARRTAASMIWPLPDHGLVRRLHRVRVPVHLIWGADDRIVPVSYLRRFSDLLPDVRGSRVVPGAGHLVEWDDPVGTAGYIRKVLDGSA
jgi:pimeloyl-ACP methyl ester carboxylesterase